MSQFDASTFLDVSTTEASAKRPPLPVDDYRAVIGELSVKEGVSPKDPTKPYTAMTVPLMIDVPGSLQESLGLTNPTLTISDSIFIEKNEAGAIDYSPGKNSKLRKYREATDLNQKGAPFAPRMLTGRVVLVKIGHREYEGELFEQVQSVAKA